MQKQKNNLLWEMYVKSSKSIHWSLTVVEWHNTILLGIVWCSDGIYSISCNLYLFPSTPSIFSSECLFYEKSLHDQENQFSLDTISTIIWQIIIIILVMDEKNAIAINHQLLKAMTENQLPRILIESKHLHISMFIRCMVCSWNSICNYELRNSLSVCLGITAPLQQSRD